MEPSPTDALVVAVVRSPIGRFGGALSAVHHDDLAAYALAADVERAGDANGGSR
jgi:acetyl-CoA acetyltransferase